MLKLLPKSIRLLLPVLVLGYSSLYSSAQTFALNSLQPTQQKTSIQETASKKLTEAIKEIKSRFSVDIIFEGGLLDNIIIPDNFLSSKGNFEQTLEKALKSTNLYFKVFRKTPYRLNTKLL